MPKPKGTGKAQVLLNKLGLTQAEAAEQLCVGIRTMSRYCASRQPPRIVVLALERLLYLHGLNEGSK